jgi:hypothetical protein
MRRSQRWSQKAADRTCALVAAMAAKPDVDGAVRVRPLSGPHAEFVRVTGHGADLPETAAAIAAALTALARECHDLAVTDLPTDTALGRHLAAHPDRECETVPTAAIGLPRDWAALPRTTRRSTNRRDRALRQLVDDGHRIVFDRTRNTDKLQDRYRTLVDR